MQQYNREARLNDAKERYGFAQIPAWALNATSADELRADRCTYGSAFVRCRDLKTNIDFGLTNTIGDVIALAALDPQICFNLVPVTLRSHDGTVHSALLGASTNSTFIFTGFDETQFISRVDQLRKKTFKHQLLERGIMTAEFVQGFALFKHLCLPALEEIGVKVQELRDTDFCHIQDAITMFEVGYLARQSAGFLNKSSA